MSAPRWWVRPATAADMPAWGAMRRALWPDEPDVDTSTSMQAALQGHRRALLAQEAGGAVMGFAELALRHDYVNGTHTSPVGFLEGWFVIPDWRGAGVGRALVEAAWAWARVQGCREFASDALLHDADSHAAHLACGFVETERVVYFLKDLRP